MGTYVMLAAALFVQANLPTNSMSTPPARPDSVAPAPALPTKSPATCNARPWQRLVGRTISDLLTISLPPGTRIYRLDDPIVTGNSLGRLNIEISRSTRVRRVYCS